MALAGRTVAITGASRGLGRAIALRCGALKARVALLARSEDRPSHGKLDSTLNEVASAIRASDGQALVVPIDLSQASADDTDFAIEQIRRGFGALDALVLNASAVCVDKAPTARQYELMMAVNVRSTHNLILSGAPLLQRSDLGHILSISPPLYTLRDKWLRTHPAYTASKYGMSMLTIGFSDTLRCNTLWPRKLYRTAATRMLEEKTKIPGYSQGLSPELFARAATLVLSGRRRGEQLLDSDLVDVPAEAVDDIFVD